jgi:putative ABC transport system permease protein
VTGTLARENTMRNPKRTAASASALMIGVGLIAFISIFATSAKASINAAVDRSFAGDFVINSGAGSTGGVDPALAQRLNALPQVAAATGERSGSMLILGQPYMIAAVDPRTAGQIFNVSPVQGSIGALGADGIAVYQDDATKHHLTLGSPVSVVFRDTGPKTLRVALIYGDNQAAPSANPGSKTSYFLGTPGYDANFAAPHFDTQVFVKKAPGVSTAAALAAVKTVAAKYAPGTTVQDQAAYKAEQTKGINQILALIYTLLALAIVIALLGIGNTLALSIFERTRELGVMRAVGMTRRQLRGTIRWESVIIALQGTLLGLVVGVFFGWALVRAQKSNGITVFSVPWLTLVIMVLLAGLAGVVAAILPSRRAAKLNVLRAIVTELYVVHALQQAPGEPARRHGQPVGGQPEGEHRGHGRPGGDADAGQARDGRGLEGADAARGGRGGGDEGGTQVNRAHRGDARSSPEGLDRRHQAGDVGQGHQGRTAKQQRQLGGAPCDL